MSAEPQRYAIDRNGDLYETPHGSIVDYGDYDRDTAALREQVELWEQHAKDQREIASTYARDVAALREQVERLRSALEGMCHQYLRVEGGRLHHDFMSAGEEAFEALGWDDMGHPVDKSCLCEVPGCGKGWTCGTIDAAGVYHCTCHDHVPARALLPHETPDGGMGAES